ncbi:MAG: hypothetical protein ACI8Y7_000306 [Candidatus Woesearchaeota archaeon]|jgi:hypothetical protein
MTLFDFTQPLNTEEYATLVEKHRIDPTFKLAQIRKIQLRDYNHEWETSIPLNGPTRTYIGETTAFRKPTSVGVTLRGPFLSVGFYQRDEYNTRKQRHARITFDAKGLVRSLHVNITDETPPHFYETQKELEVFASGNDVSWSNGVHLSEGVCAYTWHPNTLPAILKMFASEHSPLPGFDILGQSFNFANRLVFANRRGVTDLSSSKPFIFDMSDIEQDNLAMHIITAIQKKGIYEASTIRRDPLQIHLTYGKEDDAYD